MKAVIFSASAEPALLALLAGAMQGAEFNGSPVRYLLAEEVEVGSPFTTLSLPVPGLRLDVQTHGIAAVLSGEGLRVAGFVSPAA